MFSQFSIADELSLKKLTTTDTKILSHQLFGGVPEKWSKMISRNTCFCLTTAYFENIKYKLNLKFLICIYDSLIKISKTFQDYIKLRIISKFKN